MAADNRAAQRAELDTGEMSEGMRRAVSLLESLHEPYRETALELVSRLVDGLSAIPEKRAKEEFKALFGAGATGTEIFARLAELSYSTRNREPTLQESLRLSHVRSLTSLDVLMEETGGSCDTERARSLLGGISRQAVDARVARGTILWARLGRQRRFPLAQFDVPNARIHPGILGVLWELKHLSSPVSRLSFFLAPKRALGGARPIDLLKAQERVEEIKRAARLYLSQGGL